MLEILKLKKKLGAVTFGDADIDEPFPGCTISCAPTCTHCTSGVSDW